MCGTEQETEESRETGRCVICSSPLSVGVGSAADREPLVSSPLATPPRSGATVPTDDPHAGPPAEVRELIRADKRLTSWLALVPLWGPLQLSRSEAHRFAEKVWLSLLSLSLTALVAAAVWLARPTDDGRVSSTRARVEQQIETLRGLVELYAAQNHALPDDGAWQRSAASGDGRFYDPWRRIYRYRREAGGFSIGTYGQDGVVGGDGEDADVMRYFPYPPERSGPLDAGAASG